MAQGVNKVILVGNLGKDPEVRYIQSGTAVCTLRLAVSERRKDDADNWKDHTEWMDVVTWGKTAENVGEYLSKGSQVYVEGRLQTREYKDKDGNERRATEVVASQVLFVGGKSKDAPASSGAKPKNNGTSNNVGKDGDAPPAEQWTDDDLPF